MAVSINFSDRFHKETQKMQSLMQSYPGMEMGHHLNDHLQLLEAQASPHAEYPIEVLLLDMPKEEQLFRLLDFLQITPEEGKNLPLQLNDAAHRYQCHHIIRSGTATYRITLYNSAHIPVRSTSNLAPCFKLVCWFASEPPTEDEIEPILLRLDAESGIVFFLNYAAVNFMDGAPQLRMHALPPDQLPENLTVLLESDALKKILPLAHASRLLQGLEKVSASFSQYIAQQEKDIKTKKFQNQQEKHSFEQEGKLNLQDLYKQLKGGLQRDFSECERGIQDRLVRLGQRHSPNSLMAQIENRIQQVDHLQEENFAGNIRMTLPAGTQDTLVRTVFQGLRMQIDQDIFAFKEFIKQECGDLDKKMTEHHLAFSYSPQLQINLSRIEANIAEYVQFTQKYETEKKQLHFGDYLRAALGPIMAVGGLFMVMSLLGIPLRAIISGTNKFITVPIILGICGYSLYQFTRHNKARNIHEYDAELNRMRENLLTETRGMIRKVTDEWQREIIGALREELNQMVNTLENLFAHAAAEHKENIQRAQRSVQRRENALGQRESTHLSVLKNKENYDRLLAQLSGELMNQYQQQLQQL
ncbi:hypothetical protein H8B06_13770 [Sphingobacterium sp. DN00404]|uniref:Uncharacterized protein n=1 Tax=Sphingobacterium micropteri TaxID=2763501 RepID=A0ABR7YRE2_9SPHI|nr:hypothetical protein [Sphingobacterium micropteri]MBD1433901.1 hypothetical protein [Sphingobacterium micropteri]